MQVTDIWRYPVKSVPGLRVSLAEIGAYGIVGDRQYALRDCATGLVLTARREPKLLTVSALPSDDADRLSTWLGRAVELIEATDDMRGTYENPLDPFGETGWVQWQGPRGSFHDSGRTQVSLVSVATMGAWDTRRFRINLLTDGGGEDGLVGHRVRIGSAELDVVKLIDRCVMVTRPQFGGIERDLDVLRTIHRERDGNLGIAVVVRATGRVAVGDAVEILGPVPDPAT